MKRRLFTLLSAVSRVLCTGTVALWAWSYAELVRISWVNSGRSWTCAVVCSRGQVGAVSIRDDGGRLTGDASGVSVSRDRTVADIGQEWRQRGYGPSWAGFGVGRRAVPSIDYRLAMFPVWSVAALTALLPAAWAVRRRRGRREQRLAEGRCVACGYDLRATPKRCPECGAVPAR